MDSPLKIRRFEAIALTVLFSAAIALPLIKLRTVGEPDTSNYENRILAATPVIKPGWKWDVKYLPKEIDAWYADHFGFRSLLLQTNALINFRMLSVSQRAIIGRDGWLFYKLDPPLFSLSLSAKELETWKSYLEHKQQWLAARGVRYLFVVPPDKDSIYPEFLPPTSKGPPKELPVDQLVRYLKETHSSVEILSLREALLAAKAREQAPLYYKQDGHWNTLGGYYGSEAIVHHLAAWFPAIRSRPRSDYQIVLGTEKENDVAHLAGLPDFTSEKGPELDPLFHDPVRTTNFPRGNFDVAPFVMEMPDGTALPRAIIARDSFGTSLAPSLAESFSHIHFFSPSYNRAADEKMIGDAVLDEKPDVFIEEHVQRLLIAMPDEKILFGGPDKDAGGGKKP